jgi:arylsulfatase A-like enzyme
LGNDAPQFFLWVHYLDPHAEYVPHAEFEFGKNQRALYDGEIAFTDLHVGRLLSFIEQSSFAANTVLILTSDHGEAFGEHGMVRHGFELWEELVRVPLLIYVPGVSARHESTPRSAIDLIPTIYDLFRQPAPPPNTFSGHSLLPDLILPSGYQPKARPILVDMCEGPYNDERQAFIQDDKKLITSNGRPLGLYDLRDDAAEKKNLLSNTELKSTVVEQMKAFKRTLEIVNVPRR